MWQRFTERARKVIFKAQDVCIKNGEQFINTEHLLLGLLSETDGYAVRALETLKVDCDELYNLISKKMLENSFDAQYEVSLTPRAKRVLDLASEKSHDLKNNYIGTEHILLALVHEKHGVAGSILVDKLGLDYNAVRDAVKMVQNSFCKTTVSLVRNNFDKSVAPIQSDAPAASCNQVTINARYVNSKFDLGPFIAVQYDASTDMVDLLHVSSYDNDDATMFWAVVPLEKFAEEWTVFEESGVKRP